MVTEYRREKGIDSIERMKLPVTICTCRKILNKGKLIEGEGAGFTNAMGITTAAESRLNGLSSKYAPVAEIRVSYLTKSRCKKWQNGPVKPYGMMKKSALGCK